MPKVRQNAADMVRRGYTPTEVGRRFGVGSSTICKWVKKAQKYGYHPIPTLSSKPKHHPKELSGDMVWKIFHKRIQTKRCAEVVHAELKHDGVNVSLSSIKRTLDRTGLLKKRSPWKRYHVPTERPRVFTAGDLVQIDTIHLMVDDTRIYVYTLIDLYSRWAYAYAYKRANTHTAIAFLKRARTNAPFQFNTIQSDHGSEFS